MNFCVFHVVGDQYSWLCVSMGSPVLPPEEGQLYYAINSIWGSWAPQILVSAGGYPGTSTRWIPSQNCTFLLTNEYWINWLTEDITLECYFNFRILSHWKNKIRLPEDFGDIYRYRCFWWRDFFFFSLMPQYIVMIQWNQRSFWKYLRFRILMLTQSPRYIFEIIPLEMFWQNSL